MMSIWVWLCDWMSEVWKLLEEWDCQVSRDIWQVLQGEGSSFAGPERFLCLPTFWGSFSWIFFPTDDERWASVTIVDWTDF